MNLFGRQLTIFTAAAIGVLLAGCGGGGGGGSVSPPATFTLTVNSTTPAAGVAITVSPADNSGSANGTTPFSRTYNTGTAVTLTAPSTSTGGAFGSWSGCSSASTTKCTVTLSAATTVTANFTAPVAPTVTVTPASTSITTLQTLSVAVMVAGATGAPTPTGSVTLTSGSYSSSATALASGSATIVIPAGDLAPGSDTLSAAYTPDSASSSTFASATGTSAAVTVSSSATVAVNQTSTGLAVTDQLLGMNMAAWYDPTQSFILPAFQAAGIKAIRWPGGSWSDAYHWNGNFMCTSASGNPPFTPTGWADPAAVYTNVINDVENAGNLDVALTADYGTDAACTGPGDPTEAAAWVQAWETNGGKVSHVTVGNEEYGSWETDLHTLQHDAGTYATAAQSYYSDIKAVDSNVLVGVSVNPGNTPAWDPTVLSNASGSYDFVEYHYYPQAPGSESDSFLVYKAAPGLTTEINTIRTELAAAGNPNTPIYVGEIGSVFSDPGKQSWSITQGLYAGQALGEMMNAGVSRLTWWIGFGNCNGNAGNDASTLYGWQSFGAYNVFADPSGDMGGTNDSACTYGGPAGTMSPTAEAFNLFQSVLVDGENVLTPTVSGDTANVRAYAATHSGGTALVLFNLNQNASSTVQVSLSSETSSPDVKVTYYDKALYDQTNATPVVWAGPTTTDMGAQTLPLTLTLTPWSMNVVIIQ